MTSVSGTHPEPPFWHALANGTFMLPQCDQCQTWQNPSAHRCTACGSESLSWREAPSGGTVFNLMERHIAPYPRNPGPTAVIVVVDLDAGPRLLTEMQVIPGHLEPGTHVHAVLPGAPGPNGLPVFTDQAS
ncbi:MAG: OB-fold domain-containing protein [Chloroflexota bacterium]